VIEYEHEPIRGLPGDLPAGEEILWQGAPDWRVLCLTALHPGWVAGYFALFAALALASGSLFGLVASLVSAGLVIGLLAVFALLVARTTVYTITNRRVVLRIGVALNTCINLPLALIGSAELRAHTGGFGDLVLVPCGPHRIGYAMLWPHARPLRFSRAQPMLRALPEAQNVADILTHACDAIVEVERGAKAARPATHAASPTPVAARKATA